MGAGKETVAAGDFCPLSEVATRGKLSLGMGWKRSIYRKDSGCS
jgi:hypothetical protein